MRRIVLVAAITVALPAAASDVWVKPHVTRDGEYVEGHYRTKQNNTKLDNYSTEGNTNPYTGKKGTVDPYKLDTPRTYQSKPYSYEYKPYTYESPYSSSSGSKKRGY
jgi:hypothetical protein